VLAILIHKGHGTSRLYRLCLSASFAAFFFGLLISSVIYFRGKALDLKAAIISDLESPDDNPHGYGAGATGIATCGALLAPLAMLAYRRLRSVRRKLALVGTLLFSAGLLAATAIGVLAPFTRGYTPSHIQLAFAAFIGINSGTLVLLIAVPGKSRVAMAMIVLDTIALLILLFLYFGSVDFNNDHLLTSLAFCEWLLCANSAASLWVLGATVTAIPNSG
jgi:hypothetical protein